jgi:Cu/Ag efflux protein CusF
LGIVRRNQTTSAAALLAGATLAFAAEATGTIQAIDTTAGTLTLDNGQVFTLSASVNAADWKVGDRVKLTYDEANGEMSVTAVEPAS